MRVCASIGLLLVSVSFGLVAGADKTRYQKEVEKLRASGELSVYDGNGKFHLIFHSIDGSLDEANDTTLYQQEIDAMPAGFRMLHENGTLVEITMKEKPDPNTATQKFFNLPNTFQLFTRDNPTQSQLLWINNSENLAQSYFNAGRPTCFLTHGWVNSANGGACTLIRDAYLDTGDYNVIVLDWSGTSFKPYIWASNQVISIGLEVARMIDFLVDYGQLRPDETTLIGHSLGAHIMGLGGYYSKYTVGNVVGLDPALPMFQFASPNNSISMMDAKRVQIIHTNSGFLGYLGAYGHTDFYPNGGVKQPGCLPKDLLACSCSHQRAYYLFAESLRTWKPFYGTQCDSFSNYVADFCTSGKVAPMGGANLDLAQPGTYYLCTRSSPPFSNV